MPLLILLAILLLSSIIFSLLLYLLVFKSIPRLLFRLSFISRSNIIFYSLSNYLLFSLLISSTSFLLKLYLTIYNLYIRYIPLLSITAKSIASVKVLLLRVLPPIIFQDFFNKFALKLSIIPLNLSLADNTFTPQPP